LKQRCFKEVFVFGGIFKGVILSPYSGENRLRKNRLNINKRIHSRIIENYRFR